MWQVDPLLGLLTGVEHLQLFLRLKVLVSSMSCCDCIHCIAGGEHCIGLVHSTCASNQSTDTTGLHSFNTGRGRAGGGQRGGGAAAPGRPAGRDGIAACPDLLRRVRLSEPL